ncbi:hypothetical protein [Soonwooa sp.]|uniref:hypothetical protein n=1 Tax=Soonwooa sp. TaxID=1938592 RepID=UPI0028ABED52|nr:hypothetical protein [Soonwooa sp.]
MNSLKSLVLKVPTEVRALIIEEELIDKAVQSIDNKEMVKLLKIWHEFIEPDKELTACPICIGNILTNWKQMRDTIIEVENDKKILSAL